jgi:hypothetical protein
MNNKNPTPGEIVMLAAGGVALIASFLPFYSAPGGFGGDDLTTWDSGLFPVAWFIALFAVGAAVLVALQKFANMNFGAILGFTFTQILIVLGLFSAIIGIGYLINDSGFYDKGIGYWLLLLSGIAAVVGAVLVSNERKSVGPGPA